MNINKIPLCICPVLLCIIFSSCGSVVKKERMQNIDMYDLNTPTVINLPQALDEISGIAYYPKDTSVFAIIDEDGILFKIPVMHPDRIKKWIFDKSADYEDLILKDSIFYVLTSKGNIKALRFTGDQISTEKIEFPGASKNTNEFETLYFDEASGKIVIMCKQCEDDGKTQVSSFYIDSSNTFQNFQVMSTIAVAEKLGKRKEHVKPSAAAINPVTKDLYILCSVNKLLIIADNKGSVKHVIRLDPKLYKQPEGICFTPKGDMIISNEYLLEGTGQLLIFKNKKKS